MLRNENENVNANVNENNCTATHQKIREIRKDGNSKKKKGAGGRIETPNKTDAQKIKCD